MSDICTLYCLWLASEIYIYVHGLNFRYIIYMWVINIVQQYISRSAASSICSHGVLGKPLISQGTPGYSYISLVYLMFTLFSSHSIYLLHLPSQLLFFSRFILNILLRMISYLLIFIAYLATSFPWLFILDMLEMRGLIYPFIYMLYFDFFCRYSHLAPWFISPWIHCIPVSLLSDIYIIVKIVLSVMLKTGEVIFYNLFLCCERCSYINFKHSCKISSHRVVLCKCRKHVTLFLLLCI